MNKKKIIFGNHQINALQHLASAVESQGYEILIAKTGPEVLDLFEKNSPDLVILDTSLPQKDGMEILSIIKEKKPRL
ncbi:response regulator, partial [bacterium]|nr:response regulator [bacterium]